MKMSYGYTSDYYCKSLAVIDEQICELLAKRKELSDDNPGLPGQELIATWSKQYGLNEEQIRKIFASMSSEHSFPHHEQIEPTDFLKFVPIMKSVELDNILYAVTSMKQYKNASVVYIEAELNSVEENVRLEFSGFELFISPKYQCRPHGGSGQIKGLQHTFVVTPSLPDDVTEFEFRLTIRPHRDETKIISLAELPVTIK
ncbi:MAG: hypothetical protein APF81_11685 [Desulfosporosinus sp. BRH_c37]|nr:MAG: hypothetical protein APF81_11685 [Desulfosporosinus sp. BRH_c37]